MSEDKFCINCKYYEEVGLVFATQMYCKYPKRQKDISYLISGIESLLPNFSPYNNRSLEDRCGIEGKWYEPKSQ